MTKTVCGICRKQFPNAVATSLHLFRQHPKVPVDKPKRGN